MPAADKVIIAGGGIAGPAAALALRRVGIQTVVYEGYAEPADHVGSFLNVASNGIAVLEQLGVADEVVAAGIPTPTMQFWSGTGKRLGQVANGTRLPDGKTSTTIRRGEINRILREAAISSGIPVRFGKSVISAHLDGDQVRAVFADGSSDTADLLIGADGIHSTLRRVICPDGPTPRYSQLLSIGGHTYGVDVPAAPGVFNMMFGRRAFFSYLVREPGEVWWFANLPEPQEPARGQLAVVPDQVWRQRLLAAFADDRGPAQELIRRSEGPLGAYAIHDLPTVPSWHRERMVLLGDAAHATSPSAGQGVSMAVESAAELARCLGGNSRIPTALEAYERQRRPRVERVVSYSAKLSGSKTAGPVARVFRDLAMPFALRFFANEKSHAWLYDHHVELSRPSSASSQS